MPLSAYTMHVRKFMMEHTAGTPQQRMKSAAVAWRAKGGSGAVRRKRTTTRRTTRSKRGTGTVGHILGSILGNVLPF